MTKKVKIIIAIVVSLAIVGSVLGGVFGARAVEQNKREEAKRQAVAERQEAVASVEFGFLSGVDATWDYPMSNEEIAELDNAGDYVLAQEWTSLFVRILNDSPLQTEKIRSLGRAMQSENGKKLLADFENNAELIIPLLKEVGFTSGDISTLVMALLNSLIDDSANTLTSARDRLVSIKSEKSAKSVARSLATVNAELTYVSFSDTERSELHAALSDAKEAIEELASFAYNSSINALTDHIVSVIASDDGALADITDGEIRTVVNAMLSGVRELKSVMTEDKIQKLNNAILAITNKFEGNVSTSRIFSQLVNYAKLAYVFTDSIPYLCDVITTAGDVIDVDFLQLVRKIDAISDEATDNHLTANYSILAAKLTNAIYGGIEEEEFVEMLGKLYAQATTDYRRALPLIAIDMYVNLTSLTQSESSPLHPEILGDDGFTDEFMFIIKYSLISSFEKAYYAYLNDGDIDKLIVAHRDCKFEEMGIVNPYDRDTQTKEWFEYDMTKAKIWMDAEAARLAELAKDDLVACVNDYYAEDSVVKAKSDEFTKKAFIALLDDDATEEERAAFNELVNSYLDDAKDARVFGITLLLRLVLGTD